MVSPDSRLGTVGIYIQYIYIYSKNCGVSFWTCSREISGDRVALFYCATHSLFIGDQIEKNEVNRTTLREVMRFWIQIISKISAKIDTFPIFEEKSHSRDNTKILHPFFAYRLRFLYCATQRVFIEDHIYKKLCKSDHLERSLIWGF